MQIKFGQIIGITAGCEQMMNHPAVNIVDQQELVNQNKLVTYCIYWMPKIAMK